MEKKTMGEFIAALRRANGFTQQDVADRLGISNKAVSRWERDECAPDISLIPALAELLGVTCDELLKGERIFDAEQPEKSEPKVERQMKSLVNREISKFKTLIWIAFAVAFIGFVGMFCITYGFARPVIGFCVLLLFETVAVILTVIAVNKMNDVKNNSELYEFMSEELKNKYRKARGQLTFVILSVIISAVAFSLPLLLASQDVWIITFRSYFTSFVPPIASVLIIIFLLLYNPCVALLSGQKIKHEPKSMTKALKWSLLQLLLLIVAGLVLLFGPRLFPAEYYFDADMILGYIAAALLLFVILLFIVFMFVHKGERRAFVLPGIRNMLLTVPVALMDGFAVMSSTCYDETGIEVSYSYRFYMPQIWMALSIMLGIVAVFQILIFLQSRRIEKAGGASET